MKYFLRTLKRCKSFKSKRYSLAHVYFLLLWSRVHGKAPMSNPCATVQWRFVDRKSVPWPRNIQPVWLRRNRWRNFQWYRYVYWPRQLGTEEPYRGLCTSKMLDEYPFAFIVASDAHAHFTHTRIQILNTRILLYQLCISAFWCILQSQCGANCRCPWNPWNSQNYWAVPPPTRGAPTCQTSSEVGQRSAWPIQEILQVRLAIGLMLYKPICLPFLHISRPHYVAQKMKHPQSHFAQSNDAWFTVSLLPTPSYIL